MGVISSYYYVDCYISGATFNSDTGWTYEFTYFLNKMEFPYKKHRVWWKRLDDFCAWILHIEKGS